MLNTLAKETGLELKYAEEVFFAFLPLNTVQFMLKDTTGQRYLLLLSFDSMQDFYLQREQETAEQLPVWSGQVMMRQAALYRFTPAETAQLRTYILQQPIREKIVPDAAGITRMQEGLLAGFPALYHNAIRQLPAFKAYFDAISQLKTVAIGMEEGYLGAEQLTLTNGCPEIQCCCFGRRYDQPVGYDELRWKELFQNKKQPVQNLKLNLLKKKLMQAIHALLLEKRQPAIRISDKLAAQQFALNAFDQIYPHNDNYQIEVQSQAQTQYLAMTIRADTAELGTWMTPICREALLCCVKEVFGRFPQVKQIRYQNVLFDTLLDHGWRHNDFYLPLPDNVEELKSRLASKSRYNIRREKRIIAETFGGLTLEDVPCDGVPEDLKESFYQLKNATHGVSEDTYDIDQKPITNVYLLRIGTGEVKGIALSCEQGEMVFLENHTFDSTMRKYSFGQVLYDMYLDAMIEKGKLGVALAGGELEYKKRYGTVCAVARSGCIHRAAFQWLCAADRLGISRKSNIFRKAADRINQAAAKRKERT